MRRLKALDEVTPADLWREVPLAEDEFWADARERQRRLLKVLLEGALEEELTQMLASTSSVIRPFPSGSRIKIELHARSVLGRWAIISVVRPFIRRWSASRIVASVWT